MQSKLLPPPREIGLDAFVKKEESLPYINLASILEPLSQATQTSLEPIAWHKDEYLFIDVDQEVERFIVKGIRAHSSPYNDMDESFITCAGEKLYVAGKADGWKFDKFIHRIPERMDLQNGKWRIAGTDFSAIVTIFSWPFYKIVFKSEAAKTLFDYLITRFASQSHTAKQMAEFKLEGKIPELPKYYKRHATLPLSPYQEAALSFCLFKEQFALFMAAGTGKTPVVVNRVNLEGGYTRYKHNRMYLTLVLCPKQVRRNWESEFERFSVVPGKVSIIDGGQLNRAKALVDTIRDEKDCAWSACIMSIDSVDATWRALKMIPWDLVVIDESHGIKNHNSRRFMTLRHYATNGKAKQRMILTGTPIANVLFDLWAQFEFMGKGLSGFMTFENFRRFHGIFSPRDNSTPVERLIGLRGIPLIQERLARISFIMSKEEANLQLPEKVHDIYEVEMTKRQKEMYTRLARMLIVEIEDMLSQEVKTLVAEHILTKLLRLAQITSGFVKWSSGIEEQIDLDENPKAKAIVEMLQDESKSKDSKAVIWITFDEDARLVSETLHKAGIKHVGYKPEIRKEYRVKGAEEAEHRFNMDPECKVFIGNPASGGCGLNLFGYDRDNPETSTTFTDHAIFFSSNWSSVQRSQAEDRIHRRGTRNNVRITDLIVPNTIDEEIRIRVKEKIETAMAVQDIRVILQNIKDSIHV